MNIITNNIGHYNEFKQYQRLAIDELPREGLLFYAGLQGLMLQKQLMFNDIENLKKNYIEGFFFVPERIHFYHKRYKQ